MKKITFLFSLLLLFFMGGLTASAQTWKAGEMLDDVPDEDTPVALFHPGTSGDSPARWWAGTNTNTTDVLLDAGLVLFEPTGDYFYDPFLEDDVPTFRLKDYASGKYLKNVILSDWMDSSDFQGQPVTDWTENEVEAFVFTAMPGEEGAGANPRALVNSMKQSIGDGEFVLCSTYTYVTGGETVYTYLGAIAQPFLAPWQDTNAWQIFSVEEKDVREVLEAKLQEYFPNGVDESVYPSGSNPGQYNADVVNQVKAIYEEIETALAGEEMTDEEAQNYLAALERAYEMITKEAFNPMKAGYYYFKGTNGQYMYADGTDMKYTRNETVPEKPTAAAAKFIWKVTDAAADASGTPRFYFQNYQTKGYASKTKSGDFYTTSEEAVNTVYVTYQPDDSRFNLKFELNSGFMNTYYGNAAGSIGEWNSPHDGGSLWYLIALNEADVNALEEAVEAKKRYEELLATFDDAYPYYQAGRSYKADPEDDQEEIDGPDYGVPTSLVNADSWYTCGTNVESLEGSIAGLFDGIIAPSGSFVKNDQGEITLGYDNTHYYHTMWSATPTEAPYIAVALSESVETAYIKIAKRINAGNQVNKFSLYSGTLTGMEMSYNSISWSYEGKYNVTFNKGAKGTCLNADQTAMVTDTVFANATAVVPVEFSKPVRYIKIVPEIVGNQTYGGFGCYNVGELRIYPALYDEDNSSYEQVDPDVADEFSAALNAAKSEISSREATQATIDRLKAALEAFRAQLPDPQQLTDAIKAFNDYYNELPVTQASPIPLGFFPATISEYKGQVDEIAETVNPLMTRQEILDGVAQVNDLLAQLKAEIKLPALGTYYVIRGRAPETTYKNVRNAPLYAANNATKDAYAELEDGTVDFNKREAIHYMPYKQDGSQADSVNVNNHINYVWVVEGVSQTAQTIRLRNVGTGTYFGYIPDNSLSNPVYLSKEPIEVGVQSAHVSGEGYFNLIVGDGLYANGQPQTGNIVKWSSARGNDNSCFDFQEVATLMENTELDLKAGTYAVITLPYGISRFYGNGTAYTCLGQNEGNVEFKKIENGSSIPAGAPFIYSAAETQKTLNVYLEKNDFGGLVYNMDPLKVKGLVGTLEPMRISVFPSYKLTEGGETTAVSENLSNQYKEIAPNSGYFYFGPDDQTTEVGDLEVALSGYTTGIETIETAVKAKANLIYDLSGRRVQKAQKGLYIINGQKVLVK